MGLGPQEILIVIVVGILLFGAKRIPELARSLGQGLKELRRSAHDVMEPFEEVKTTLQEGKSEVLDSLPGGRRENGQGKRTSQNARKRR